MKVLSVMLLATLSSVAAAQPGAKPSTPAPLAFKAISSCAGLFTAAGSIEICAA